MEEIPVSPDPQKDPLLPQCSARSWSGPLSTIVPAKSTHPTHSGLPFFWGPRKLLQPQKIVQKHCLGLLFLLLKDSQFFCDCLLATKTANPFVFVERKVEFLSKS